MSWDPACYLSFGQQRLRAAADLLARVPLERPAWVADLGCGPGYSTRLLADRWPQARIVGVDSSPEMLAEARRRGPIAQWVRVDVSDWRPRRRFDLIFANAVLHWLDDHEALVPRLMSHLRPGGVLAVQMPKNFAAPSHALLRETAASGPWALRLAAVLREEPVGDAAYYYGLFSGSAISIDIWETEYLQTLEGEDAVLNWVRGTALRPVIKTLDGEQLAAFEARYAERLRKAYPRRLEDGLTLFAFKRLFIVAVARREPDQNQDAPRGRDG
jgi:trans-aconitate 2-methyltransferase